MFFAAIGRFLIATAAGAGLGAGAALYRRHLLDLGVEPQHGEHADDLPATPPAWTRDVPSATGTEPDAPAAPAPATPTLPETSPSSTTPAPTPPAPVAAPQPTAADIAALQASVADLEAARQRLRERAAALRAEMEGGST